METSAGRDANLDQAWEDLQVLKSIRLPIFSTTLSPYYPRLDEVAPKVAEIRRARSEADVMIRVLLCTETAAQL